jgi:dedicator of cytokinesis protein 3
MTPPFHVFSYSRGLLSTVQHYAEVVRRAGKDVFPQIQKCFESLEFIFKFIVQSLILFARATYGEIRASFSNNVSSLFGALNALLLDPQTDFRRIQGALLRNLSKMYKELIRVMPAVELTRLVVELFTNIPLKSEDVYSPPKLVALHDLVKSSLFSDKGNLTSLILTGF